MWGGIWFQTLGPQTIDKVHFPNYGRVLTHYKFTAALLGRIVEERSLDGIKIKNMWKELLELEIALALAYS